jgi:flagellar protein FlaG
MSTTSAIPALASEPQGPAPVRPPAEDIGAAGPSAHPADLRLVIEEDKASNSFVYKTVDARTGKVVQQFPREEILRLKAAPAYEPGAVISARG